VLYHPYRLIHPGSKNLRNIEPSECRGPVNQGDGNPPYAAKLELSLRGVTGVLDYGVVIGFTRDLTGEHFNLTLDLRSQRGPC
jgi:hypothetical protein